MTAVLKVSVEDLDGQFVEDLKNQFSGGELEIHVHDQPEEAGRLSEAQFWDIIAQLDWTKEGDDVAVLEPAIQFLSAMPLANIYQFADQLAEKLWRLDTRAHAQVFLDDAEAAGYLSVDDFLYARCAVVANGRATYEAVLQHPATMPTDFTFEPLLHLAPAAYRRKTGKESVFVSPFAYETYSNREGWAS